MGHRDVGDFGHADLPDESAMPIPSGLEPGETLVWTGRPRSPRRLVIQSIPKALFGLSFLAFTLFWMAMVVRGGHNNWDRGREVGPFEPHNILIATFVGLWFLPPGLYMLTWPLRTWWRLERTHYALTDRRALVVEPGLLGRPKLRSYTADSLRLMRLEEHGDGTGDLIFESPPNRVGMAQSIGFLAIEEAREVEALVRGTLFSPGLRSESPTQAACHEPMRSDRRTYRISLGIRLFQFVFLAAGLLTAICIIGNLVLFLGVLIFQPNLLVPLIDRMNPPGACGTVGAIVAGVGSVVFAALVAWNFFQFALATQIEISIDEEGAVGFRTRLRMVTIPAGAVTSITTGAWYDPNKFQAVVRHKGGKLTLINQFTDFRDFLATLKALNPAVEIKGF